MSRGFRPVLFAVWVLLCWFGASAAAQVKSIPLPNHIDPDSITVIFPADVKQMDGANVSANSVVPPPSIYVKEGGRRTYLTCGAELTGVARQVKLSGFKTLQGDRAVHLVRGSDDGGVALPPVPAAGKRIYIITWESVRLETQGQPSPILTVAKVGASADNEPSLSANLSRNDQEFVIGSEGVAARDLLAKFKATPGKIGVVYEFDKNDPAADFRDHAASLRGEPNDTNPHSIIVDVGRNVPRRPEPYTVILEFPSADLQGLLQPGYAIPANKMFVSAAEEINLAPPSTERAKTEFFFEATFTSIVDAASRERSNVGLFGVHLKPTLPMLTGNVFDRSDSPWWIAFRPLFDADVDTQPIKDSQAPNRVVFGMDFELGRDAGIENASSFLQQIVWLNGIRYDSDRDFKLKTLYWQTELVPYFIKFEQTREQRLRRFRFPGGIRQADRGRRFPVVSSYKLQPSVGYQLGGIIAGEERATRLPTDRISRLFVKLSAATEFRRLLQLSLDDTYYFLENAPRRRNRNYLEARLDFNTGSLFNVDLGALQSAITLKFQRGDLPPAFSPVNSLSMGVRLYK